MFHGSELWTFPRGLWRILRLDPVGYIDEICRVFADQGLDGVLSTDEYIGNIIAAAVAHRLGLPTAKPGAILNTCHKYYSRLAQRKIVPEAVPDFQLLSVPPPKEQDVQLQFPFFVKPVRGSFSMFSKRIDSYPALRRHLNLNPLWKLGMKTVLRPFNDLYRHYLSSDAIDVNRFIAEGLLEGQQVCVDGFVHDGDVHVLGVVDARFFPGTHAFERFQYPSALSPDVQRRIHAVVHQLITGMDLQHGPFNVELIYDDQRDHIHLLELHPRISYQFADLYEDVDGTNTYDLMLDLAVGEKPRVHDRCGRYPTSASLVIRKFHGKRVTNMPDPYALNAFALRNPTARVEMFAKRGSMNPEMRAMGSYRCALINVGGCRETIAAARRDADRSLLFDVV